MWTKLARYAVVAAMGALASGCLYETTLDANGGGVMSITLQGSGRKDLEPLRAKLESATIKVLTAEASGEGPSSQVAFKIQFDDVTKLSTAALFRNVSIKRTAGVNGSQVLTGIVHNVKPSEVSDAEVERLGKHVQVVVTFPGPVIESNGTTSAPNTVTWTWGIKEFFKQSEVVMTAAYTPGAAPAAGPTAALTPAT